jgi:hypothetical protein
MKRIITILVFFSFSHQLFSQCSGLNITVTGQDVPCYDYGNGQINYTVSGGSGNFYIYAVLDSSIVYSASNANGSFYSANGGFYEIIVSDNVSGCMDTVSITILEPAQLMIEFDTLTAVSCYGLCDGTLNPIISGGTTPYTFLWKRCPCPALPRPWSSRAR